MTTAYAVTKLDLSINPYSTVDETQRRHQANETCCTCWVPTGQLTLQKAEALGDYDEIISQTSSIKTIMSFGVTGADWLKHSQLKL